MNRKQFIGSSVLSAFSLTTLGSVLKTKNQKHIGDCETTNDILGPFYRPNAPIRSDLTFKGLVGTIITIEGIVFKSDCVTLFKNVLVEIWHCDTNGNYDNKSKLFKHRGCAYTNEKGEYSFKTIIPGKYLNGNLYRPSHIHFRVTEQNSKELISQIYFKGDPHITEDPWASNKNAEHRILSVAPINTNGSLKVKFDIYMNEK